MTGLQSFATRHPILYAIAVTFAFVAILIVANIPASGRSDHFVEAYSLAVRVVIAAMVIGFARAMSWSRTCGFAGIGSRRSWAIILGPLIYLAAVFPFLFTGSWAPNLAEPGLTLLTGANGFAAGATEEMIFRGLIFFVIAASWGGGRAGAVKAALTCGIVFSLPHLMNVFEGHQAMRVLAQLGWALVLGIAMAWLAFVGRTIWPVAFLHGALDAIVHANRIGVRIEVTPQKGLVMVAASLPVLVYAWILLRNRERNLT